MGSFKETHPPDPGHETGKSELIENFDHLRQLSIFKDISFDIVKLFAYTAVMKKIPESSIIFNRGEWAEQAYFVISGTIRLFVEKEVQKVEVQQLEAGDFFGFMSLLAGFEWPLSSQTVTDAEVLMLNRKNFRRILTRFPEQCVIIVERLVQKRMKRLNEHMDVMVEKLGERDMGDLI